MNVSPDEPTGTPYLDGMTPEGFVDWLYGYWQRVEKGVPKRGRICFKGSEGDLHLLHMAELMGVTKLLGVRLVE